MFWQHKIISYCPGRYTFITIIIVSKPNSPCIKNELIRISEMTITL